MISRSEEDGMRHDVENDLQEPHNYSRGDEDQNKDHFADEMEDHFHQDDEGRCQMPEEVPARKQHEDPSRPLQSSTEPHYDTSPPEREKRHIPSHASHAREDDQSTSPQKREGSSRDVNENFQDVENTGRWGSISKMEIIFACILVLAIVTGIALVLVFVVFPGGEDEKKAVDFDSLGQNADKSNLGPFPDVPSQDQLDTILLHLKGNKYVSSDLVNEADFYDDYTGDDAAIRAMAWLLRDEREPSTDDPWLIYRYGLAKIYFSLGGEEWINNDNWLSKRHACDWHGMRCNLKKNLIDIDLSMNNLRGILPAEFNLFEDVRSLLLSRNEISGDVPWDALGNMKSLGILYLDDNKLTGTYSEGIIANGILSTLFVQENNLTGKWPRSLCPLQGEPSGKIFDQLRVDCNDELSCFCCTEWNCF